MTTTCSTVLLLILCGLASAKLPLPSYIKACSRSDPNFDACGLKSARDTLPHVINGDKKYKVPPLDPFKIDRLEVDDGHGPLGLAFVAREVSVKGLRDVRIDEINNDLIGRHVDYKLFLPRIEIESKYNISGKILVLPIVGDGAANITMVNMYLTYSYNFTKKTIDGVEYGIPQESHLDFNTTRLYVHLSNLFNGDKVLGESTNQALDDNWQELLKSVGPIVSESIGEVLRTILINIFELVPFDTAFPE